MSDEQTVPTTELDAFRVKTGTFLRGQTAFAGGTMMLLRTGLPPGTYVLNGVERRLRRGEVIGFKLDLDMAEEGEESGRFRIDWATGGIFDPRTLERVARMWIPNDMLAIPTSALTVPGRTEQKSG